MLPFRACRYPAEGQAQGDGDRRGMEVRLCCVAQRRAGRQAILGDGAGHLDQHQGRLEVPLQGVRQRRSEGASGGTEMAISVG